MGALDFLQKNKKEKEDAQQATQPQPVDKSELLKDDEKYAAAAAQKPATEKKEGTFLNRKLIISIGAVVLSILLVATIFSLQKTSTDKNVKKTPTNKVTTGLPDGLKNKADSYDAETAKDLKNKQNQKKTTASKDTPIGPVSQVPIQHRSYSFPNTNPTVITPVGSSSRSSESNDLLNAFKSPIRFVMSAAEAAGLTSSSSKKTSDSTAQQSSQSTQQNTQGAQNDPNGQDEKEAFLSQKRDSVFYSQSSLQSSVSEFEIKSGTIIPGVMISGINSDLPGLIKAQVRENVYDSVSGDYLLIPQGAMLLGQYDSKVTYGQERILVVWTQLIMPNGEMLNLESMQGYDQSGYSGFTDKVDNHTGKIITGCLVSGLLGGLTGWAESKSTVVVNAAEKAENVGEKLVDKALNIQPSLVIEPGYRFDIIVNKTFVLKPYEG